MRLTATIITALLLLGACSDAPTSDGGSTSATASPDPEPVTLLDEAAAREALPTIEDLPTGFSLDPEESEPSDKTFCDYTEPSQPQVDVSEDFLRGSGFAGEFASARIRQYASVDEARAAYEALADTLQTCTDDEIDGSPVTFSLVNAEDLGEESLAVRITADGAEGFQYYSLVGAAVIRGVTGGVTVVDQTVAPQIASTTVDRYSRAIAD